MTVTAVSAVPVSPRRAGVNPLDQAVRDFERTGQIEASAFAGADPAAVQGALSSLPPASRGAMECELRGQGLGGLLGGVVEGATGTVAEVADNAVETPSEHRAEEMGTAWQVQGLDRLRAQGHLDATLSSYRSDDREPAAHATNVSVRPDRDDRIAGANRAE